MVGGAVGYVGFDLQGQPHIGAGQTGQVRDHLFSDLAGVAPGTGRVQRDGAVVALCLCSVRVPIFTGSFFRAGEVGSSSTSVRAGAFACPSAIVCTRVRWINDDLSVHLALGDIRHYYQTRGSLINEKTLSGA